MLAIYVSVGVFVLLVFFVSLFVCCYQRRNNRKRESQRRTTHEADNSLSLYEGVQVPASKEDEEPVRDGGRYTPDPTEVDRDIKKFSWPCMYLHVVRTASVEILSGHYITPVSCCANKLESRIYTDGSTKQRQEVFRAGGWRRSERSKLHSRELWDWGIRGGMERPGFTSETLQTTSKMHFYSLTGFFVDSRTRQHSTTQPRAQEPVWNLRHLLFLHNRAQLASSAVGLRSVVEGEAHGKSSRSEDWRRLLGQMGTMWVIQCSIGKNKDRPIETPMHFSAEFSRETLSHEIEVCRRIPLHENVARILAYQKLDSEFVCRHSCMRLS